MGEEMTVQTGQKFCARGRGRPIWDSRVAKSGTGVDEGKRSGGTTGLKKGGLTL